MKHFTNNKFSKLFVFLAGAFSITFLSVFVSAQVSIPLSFDNAVEYIKRLVVTDSGGNSGNVLLDIDGSGKIITINTGYIIDGSGWNNKALGLSDIGQLIYVDQATSSAVTGDYFSLAGNSSANPVTGPFYMSKGSGSLKIEIQTGVQLGLPVLGDIPVLTPTAYLPGMGAFKIMVTKGRQFFMGEPGQNTQMYLANSTGNIGWKLDSDDATAKFTLQPFTGGATAGLMGYTQWNVDGTIQAGNTNIITAINAGPAETYVTKGRVNSMGFITDNTSNFVTLGTNQTITGDKTFEGTTYMNGVLKYKLGWMGSTNTGFSVDENGIEYDGYSCSDFGATSLMSKECITALVTGYNYLTGYTETDPVFMAQSGNFIPRDSSSLGYYYQTLVSSYIEDDGGGIRIQGPKITVTSTTSNAVVVGNSEMYIEPTTGDFYIKDSRAIKKGLEYYADYCASATSNSLIDKSCITALVTGYDYVPMTLTGNWNTAFGRGNHATMGYITGSSIGRALDGNAGVTGNVIGTTNNYPLVFIVNGAIAGQIDSSNPQARTLYGYQAGITITTAEYAVGMGYRALNKLTEGNRNTAVGVYALGSTTIGTDNTCIGVYCMQSNIVGSRNSSVGDESLFSITDGIFNSAIGMGAGMLFTSGDNNTFLGHFADVDTPNLNDYITNSTAIGANAKVTESNMIQLGDTNITKLITWGNVGIGTNNPTHALTVSGSMAAQSLIISQDKAGNACSTTGEIIFSGGNFMGCNGSARLQLNN